MSEYQISPSLRANVDLLGKMLGECIAETEGDAFLAKIETIRSLSKATRAGKEHDYQALANFLNELSNAELIPVARAFSHFLNLSNIADQHQVISREMDEEMSATQTLLDTFQQLKDAGHQPDHIRGALDDLKIELVLTAHPTEITRRSLINKHTEIDDALSRLELSGLTKRETATLHARIAELVAQIWHTGDFREHRPTPIDEANWGFAVIENSLWDAVPQFMRRLDKASNQVLNEKMPLDYAPASFGFWMGSDRDGNPNVTATVTRRVLTLARWKATDLYLNDIQDLIDELSMHRCDDALRALADGQREPYRYILRELRQLLNETKEDLEKILKNEKPAHSQRLTTTSQLWDPLVACYRSLHNCGMGAIADSKLLDMLRRVASFGAHLVKFDIRQESDRHTEVLSELTRYLGMDDYATWDEAKKQAFLLQELQSKRPLIPLNWQPSEAVQEVLDTCREISKHHRDSFGVYVISMASSPSDVLLVRLLMQECGCTDPLPVAPLFETLEDLNNAADVIQQLVDMPWYRDQTNSRQTVMIGYSDSAKDAGVIAAGWAQYHAQESLLQVCEASGVSLTLFHGRGGTIGRGGAPAHAALLSQPPGSLAQGLRVTEQGEMIRANLGLPSIATKSLAVYTSAILQANLDKPPVPSPAWRDIMDDLSALSCANYRDVVRGHPNFVPYFRTATPEQELGKLPLGSRPARRKAGGGIETLRAIPWIFAWSQNRLMLPAWLGAGAALQSLIDQGKKATLEEMCERWPFFSTRISMLEMVVAKSDIGISAHYDSVLVDDSLQALGQSLRDQLEKDIETILSISNDDSPMDDMPQIKASVDFRNTYVDPLNLLQAELLRRNRAEQDEGLEQAIMVTIAGISAGLRNTG